MRMLILVPLLVAAASAGVSSAQEPASTPAQPVLRFQPAGTNGFAFDTGVLRGKLRADGKSKGLSAVIHVPSGMVLDSSQGLFSHYRVFTTNHRYGTAAWDWPSEAALAADGSVEVRWPAAADRPFELSAVYRWAAPNALNLETRVQAQTNLAKFESFLASYFAEGFTNAAVWVRPDGQGTGRFMRAEQSCGHWLAFPRDEAAAWIIQDGRWKYAPSPVDWVIMSPLAQPLGGRRCPANGLQALLMSPPQDCFAVLTPFETEPHRSMYLSLFGRDVKAGETARARARLVIGMMSEETTTRLLDNYLQPSR